MCSTTLAPPPKYIGAGTGAIRDGSGTGLAGRSVAQRCCDRGAVGQTIRGDHPDLASVAQGQLRGAFLPIARCGINGRSLGVVFAGARCGGVPSDEKLRDPAILRGDDQLFGIGAGRCIAGRDERVKLYQRLGVATVFTDHLEKATQFPGNGSFCR